MTLTQFNNALASVATWSGIITYLVVIVPFTIARGVIAGVKGAWTEEF